MRFASILLCSLLLLGCGSTRPNGNTQRTVVTSTSVIADLVRNIAGEKLNVVSLVPAGSNPQQYEPTPQDLLMLSDASVLVFFANGLHLEGFLQRIVTNAAAPSLRIVELAQELRTLTSEIDHGDHNHVFINPYLYLDVRNAMRYCEKIRDTLIAVDAANADTYRANAQSYLAELESLDRWIANEVARLPDAKRRFMKDHASFPYYADRYGLIDYAASYEGTQEVAPTPSQYATLIAQVQKHNIYVLFGEAGYSPKLLEQLARDTGARYVPGLHASTLGTTPDTNSYIQIMRWNTRLIVENLQ